MSFKIALLEPASSIRGCYTHAGHNEFEPIGLEYVAAVLKEAKYEVEIFRQGSLSTEDIVDIVREYSPSVLGFSVMTHVVNYALAVAKLAKERISGLHIIAGGYHPSGDHEFVLNSEIDYTVIGEGERVFLELVKCLQNDGDLTTVRGISFEKEGEVFRTPPADRIEDLDLIPFPIRSEEILAPARMHALMLPTPSKQHNIAMLLSSRGCPNSCYFCCSGSVWGNKVIFRNPENVISEIDSLIGRFGTNAVFFSDLTFNCDNKHVIDLCKKMADHGGIPPWYAMCTIANLTDELIEAMREAGCRKIGFGIESLSNTNLKRIGKRSITIHEKTNRVLKACDRNGILTKAYLMIGYPWESHESLNEFQKDVQSLCADEIRISYFTPFPGSSSYKKYSNQLVTKDWSKFNAIRDVILQNKNGVSAEELQDVRISAFHLFYNNPKHHDRIKCKVTCFPELKDSFNEFYDFLRDGNVLIPPYTDITIN